MLIPYSVKTSLPFFLKEKHCSLKSALKTDLIDNQNAMHKLLGHSGSA